MFICTKVVFDSNLNVVEREGFEYNGPVDLACGASSGMKSAGNALSSFGNTMMGWANSAFGTASNDVQNIMNTFMPIAKAGINQSGYSLPTMANLTSQIVSNNATAAKNAKEAAGEQIAASGGGNLALPAGYKGQVFSGIDTSIAENQANQLGQLEYQNQALGRENFFAAESALAGAPQLLDKAIESGSAATTTLTDSFNAQNQINQASNSWQNLVGGVLGDVTQLGVAGIKAGSGNNNNNNSNG